MADCRQNKEAILSQNFFLRTHLVSMYYGMFSESLHF